MAAKKERGGLKEPFSSENKPYFFDVGIADEMAVCYSCHTGGGPAEGIVNNDGTVTPYDDPTLKPVHTYDRDFYSYSSNDVTNALISGKSIAQTVSDIGAPKKHDWSKSGVMEADCLLCHIDPDYNTNPYVYTASDGLKVQPFRPRMMIFAERDASGNVVKVSLGMALKEGILNQSALTYTNGIMRMSRPIGAQFFQLAQMPKEMVGELFKIWTDGLKKIDPTGKSLPYALYAPASIVPNIYDKNGLKAAYTYNPNGSADEMAKLTANQQAIGAVFQDLLTYINNATGQNLTMDSLYSMFFNEFVYGYEIKDPGTGALLPIPYPLRYYAPGKFYTDWDDPNASVRDYVRSPLVEGEGIQYSGLVGLGWGAFQYAFGKVMQGDYTYYDNTSFFNINLTKVIADWTNGKIPFDALKNMATKHDYLPYFFKMIPTAGLMGLDINHDGTPLTYVQIVKSGSDWTAKAYYNASDLGTGSIPMDGMLFGGNNDINSWKWVKVCGQCHVMTKDHGNSEWTKGRLYNLGMPADWVKNGHYVNFTSDEDAPGYDVHMSGKKMGCGSCHLRTSGSLEDKHNFLKGTDTAHMARNDLDNNPKPRTCEYCHLNGGDSDAPNPTKAHEEKFGESTGRHIAEVACQTCHAPFRKTWRFRTFDDTLGYYSNFDNRFGYYILMGGTSNFPAMAFPPYYALSPVYGTSPGYGIPHFHMVSQTINADGNGIQPMDYVAQMVDYFWFDSEADTGKIVNGLMTNPKFDFWKMFYQISLDKQKELGVPVTYNKNDDHMVYPPLYWANGANGYPQIVIGNPITILTWVDANPEEGKDMSDLAYNGAKVLYLREINAAIDKYLPVANFYAYTQKELENIEPQACKDNPNIGKVVLKDSGYVICDHTGDGFPDIWWDDDVKAMQEALTKVLKAEGVKNPKPMLFMAAHYFSDSHGIQPKEKALGATSCYDCHGDYKKDAGAHRITDRIIQYMPWVPAWFKEENRALKYNHNTGKMEPANANGFFIVDGEIDYVDPIEANNLKILGARAKDVLALSKHHAEELFYMTTEGEVSGTDLGNDFGVTLSDEEKKATYLKQVVVGPWNDKNYFYVPKTLKKEITEMGFEPQKEHVYLEGKGFSESYILKIGFEKENHETMIVKIPFEGTDAEIYRKDETSYSYKRDRNAEVISYLGSYVVVKVKGGGEYVAVEKGNVGPGPEFEKLWGAFMK